MKKNEGIKSINKSILVIITFFTMISILMSILYPFANMSYAAQRQEIYNGSNLDTGRYPGYAELMNSLRNEHPNWKFTLLYTGLDWNSVLDNENTGHHRSPLNLIPYDKGAGWRCTICGDELYDNGTWCCASKNALAYQIDPRNSLNNNDVFQFEDARFVDGAQTVQGIMSRTNNTFLKGESVANALLQAGRNANLNPYFVVSRLIQEQGPNGTTLSKGYSYNGQTVYNPFNIGASGNGSSTIIQNGAKYAFDHGWFSLEAGILGGITFINDKYMGKGQVSAFFQKFDVVDQDGNLYSNQYMQNLQAPQFEGVSTRKQYEASGTKNSSINFVIPLFENMPRYNTSTGGAPRPTDSATTSVVTMNMKTNCTVNMRNSANAVNNDNKIRSISNGTTVLAIEEGIPGQKIVNGQAVDTTFNKVVLDDGTYGYIVASALDQVNDIITSNETLVINTTTELRNGPGTDHTTVITSLPVGQIVTRIDCSRYDLNGVRWDRIRLDNGQQGFINTVHLSKQENLDIVEVNANPSLRLREGPGPEYTRITAVDKGTRMVRIQKATSKSSDGAYWDKVVTNDGVVGYCSRDYLIEITNPTPSEPDPEPTPDPDPEPPVATGFKVEGDKIITEPGVKVVDIKNAGYTVASATKDGNNIGDQDNLGTGTIIITDKGTFTIAKLGDVNGDGEINSSDLLAIQKHLLNVKTITDATIFKAADANKDTTINSSDLLKIQKYLLGAGKIEI